MTIEQTKEIMEHNWSKISNPDYTDEELGDALNIVIKSLDMWDNIIEELEKEMNEYENVLSDLSYSDGVGYALAVIEEHLGGEC